jgi:Raf kinase inhibitor-like YbhB/YbcL family protein
VNISPELHWEGAPPETQSFALVMDDPDARGFVHWVVWNIPPEATSLPEDSLPEGVSLGVTGFGEPGYGGPCPPSGAHHYSFRLYALDALLDLEEGASLRDLEAAMEGHILAETELVGTFTPR